MVIFYGKIHERFISRKNAGIGGWARKESESYGTMFRAIALKAFWNYEKNIAATVNSQEATGAYFY